MMKNLLYLLMAFSFIACSIETKPIAYGKDACDFCEMTIVSKAYSAQAVSEKGKQFKYDAIECMVNDLQDHSTVMEIQQVADFSNPGSMIEVETALFIINDSINSPMGAHLAAVPIESSLASPQSADTFFWNDLIAHFQEKDSVFNKE